MSDFNHDARKTRKDSVLAMTQPQNKETGVFNK
jgi:hypothetical protein